MDENVTFVLRAVGSVVSFDSSRAAADSGANMVTCELLNCNDSFVCKHRIKTF